MSTISGNLATMAKEIDTCKKKAEKLRDKGAKAPATKVASAVSEVENATVQWESQAPYVFEKLQAVDESRLNHLRDVLTQCQTHEVDQVERNRVTAEETLNTLLNVDTADEVGAFARRTRADKPEARKPPNLGLGAPSRLLNTPAIPSLHVDEESSQKSGSGRGPHPRLTQHQADGPGREAKPGGLQGLKRFGTVLSRRRQSTHPYGRAVSPERKSSTNLASSFSFGKGKSKEMRPPSSSDRPSSPPRRLSMTPRQSDASSSPKHVRRSSSDRPNGMTSDAGADASTSARPNGTDQQSIPQLKEPLSPPAPAANPEVGLLAHGPAMLTRTA